MAIPATFDIYYYRGDTYTFYLNVKDSEGNLVDLEAGGYSALFTIATSRGANPTDSWVLTPDITTSQITCTITPTVGLQLDAGPYVYDVQVKLDSSTVYTYLTGNIYITLDVSEAG